MDEAVQDGVKTQWSGKQPKNLHIPLRDGDEERADEYPEYKNMMFLNANSKNAPGVVDKDLNVILDPDDVYSGCWGRASVNFFPYDSNGNRGIGVGLNNLQKLKDGERLGGGRLRLPDDADLRTLRRNRGSGGRCVRRGGGKHLLHQMGLDNFHSKPDLRRNDL